MTKPIFFLRRAGAAIAAVLALSSTTVLAQVIIASPAMPAPAPTMPVPALGPPLGIPQTAPAPAPVPAPVIVIPTQPTAPVVVEPASAAPRVARQPATRASATARPAARAVALSPVSEARSSGATGPVPAVEATPSTDIEFAPVQTELPADAASGLDNAVAAETDDGLGTGELGMIGGALAIGGIAAAALLARRRRRDPTPESADVFAARSPVPPTPLAPQPVVAPLVTRHPVADGSDFHVRQAEQGPTADNPFVTRKNRLRRAHFLDAQRTKSGPADRSAAVRTQAAAGTSDWSGDRSQQNRAGSGPSGDRTDDGSPRLAPASTH